MSGTNAADGTSPVASNTLQQDLVNAHIFIRDVNEAFLLIDHISGRTEKSLSDVDTKDIKLPVPVSLTPAAGDAAGQTAAIPSTTLSVADVMDQLCQIGYPPDADRILRAHKAAFVLTLKDRLNALASPARGITIAYTAMFISATDGWSWIWPFRKKAPDRRPGAPHHDTTPHAPANAAAGSAGHPQGNSTAAPRASAALSELAMAAYPGLAPHARRFARILQGIPIVMFIVLVLTASAYWDVGFGRTVVQRIEQLQAQRTALLYPDPKTSPNGTAVTEAECAGPVPQGEPRACAQLADLDNQIKAIRGDLSNFAGAAGANCTGGNAACTGDWVLSIVRWLRPISYGFLFNGQTPSADHPETAVAWVLSVFSTYVLPAMFGLLGTFVAVMRAIQAKVRDSLLSPRDLPLSILGLFVGPMAGLAVGLYFAPDGTPAAGTAGLAGSVTLSASGLGFLAGYGADAFFKFLDALLARVFALESRDR